MDSSSVYIEIPSKNVQRGMTFNRFLYAALRDEAEKLNIDVSDIVHIELSKLFFEKIQLLKAQEKNKYNS
jgi:hypothetical protein